MHLYQPIALILDDDPSHLKIYSWIVERAGFRTATVLVRSASLDLPEGTPVSVIIMDYRYSNSLTADDILDTVKSKFPEAPVIVLSELFELPIKMTQQATAFVRKGDPEKLVAKLNEFRDTGRIETRF